jgi:hypothetical protein
MEALHRLFYLGLPFILFYSLLENAILMQAGGTDLQRGLPFVEVVRPVSCFCVQLCLTVQWRA